MTEVIKCTVRGFFGQLLVDLFFSRHKVKKARFREKENDETETVRGSGVAPWYSLRPPQAGNLFIHYWVGTVHIVRVLLSLP